VFFIEVWQSTLVVVLLWQLTGVYGAFGAALAWLLAVGSSQIISFLLARRLVSNPLADSLLPLVLVFVAALAGAATAIAVTQLVPGIVGLFFAVSVSVGVTGGLLWVCDERLQVGLRNDLRQAFPFVARLVDATAIRHDRRVDLKGF
jgi:O-antigen/teichoic acid export membrane protein